jgi:hypothetical protein
MSISLLRLYPPLPFIRPLVPMKYTFVPFLDIDSHDISIKKAMNKDDRQCFIVEAEKY